MCRPPPTLSLQERTDSDSAHAFSLLTSVLAVCCIHIDVSASAHVAVSAVDAIVSPFSKVVSMVSI
jgi:hypothetical protein